jgi:pyridoxal 5'-phosphate synthase pdxT subunit
VDIYQNLFATVETVGVLALQGDFELHEKALGNRGLSAVRVRRISELAEVGGLVIPGGESTTMTRLIDRIGMRESLVNFTGPILGTCAGLIMLSKEIEEDRDRHGVEPLGLLDVVVRRNGFGTQLDSFSDTINWSDNSSSDGVFIRAPRILEIGIDVEVIAKWKDEPVAVRQGNIVGLTYHPEVG